MRIAVVIETKDRRLNGGQNYLCQTLENLERAGVWQSPHLHSLQIVSGGEQDEDFFINEIPEGTAYTFGNDSDGRVIRVHLAPVGCTRQQNAARAIRAGAQADADWVLKLEDDLDFCADFLSSTARWLHRFGHLPTPMFSLAATFQHVGQSKYATEGESVLGPGDSFPRVRGHLRAGASVLPHPIRGFWGAQALLWKRPVAQQLADWLGDDPFLYDGKEQHRERGHDLLLQVWGQAVSSGHGNATSFAVAVPSFVQHIGRQSNLSRPGLLQPFFEFPWPGREWSFK
jgi:hypothetical protein